MVSGGPASADRTVLDTCLPAAGLQAGPTGAVAAGEDDRLPQGLAADGE